MVSGANCLTTIHRESPLCYPSVQSRNSTDLEVFASSSNSVNRSSNKFDVKPAQLRKKVDLCDISKLSRLHKSVGLEVKVLSSGKQKVVPNRLKKQDLIVADNTGSARLTVWESEMGTMEAGKSYCLTNVMIRLFQHPRAAA